MTMEFEYETICRPNRKLSQDALDELHASLRELGALCLCPLPDYQVFNSSLSAAFEDKLLVVARQKNKIMAFVSVVLLETPRLEHPVVHSGLSCIHPDFRRSKGVLQQLFGYAFLHLLTANPKGVWMTTVTDIVSSLVHMTKYCISNFPSPDNITRRGHPGPSDIHLQIARDFSANHRSKAIIHPTAEFDEGTFVFRGSNDHESAAAFLKDIDDPSHWHRDHATSAFYRGLIGPGTGDEVLLVGFLDPEHLKEITNSDRFRDQWMESYAKL
ncbi:hypothetical protein SLS62_007253 [Diatrype stigma]|uniref:Uncharacterized protein n=1 Tax=Diatrype stigma TaxID=117547 RepID=A0AAN9UX53_9PEZI